MRFELFITRAEGVAATATATAEAEAEAEAVEIAEQQQVSFWQKQAIMCNVAYAQSSKARKLISSPAAGCWRGAELAFVVNKRADNESICLSSR